MVGWHHQLNGHEFEQAPGDDEVQGSLACCSSWGHKESYMTEWLNNKAPKLTRTFGSKWVITPLWLSGLWRSFLYTSMYSCQLFLISSASVRSKPFQSFIMPIFAWNIPSNFLEENSNLSHSIVFLYFFALITEEGFLIHPCYSLEFCFQMDISFLFSFVFSIFYFLSYLLGILRQPFCLYAFLFLGDGLDHS